MAAALGINVGGPDDDPAAIAATGAKWVRVVVRNNLDFRPWLTDLQSRGIDCLFVGDSSPESLGQDEAAWPDHMAAARERYGDLVKIWQWGNEPDWNGIASWTMDKALVNHLLTVARRVFPEGEYTLVAPGLVSGQPSWLNDIRLYLVDALDVHPYAKFADTLTNRRELNFMLEGYLAYRKSLWLGEYDSRTPGLSAYLAAYPGVERAAVFCWDSRQTEAEGITGMGIKDNPEAMSYFLSATGGPVVAKPPVIVPIPEPDPAPAGKWVEGYDFEAWARLEPNLIGEPAEMGELGFASGVSLQRSTNGTLFWVGERAGPDWATRLQRSAVLGFLDNKGARHRWYPGMAKSERVAN